MGGVRTPIIGRPRPLPDYGPSTATAKGPNSPRCEGRPGCYVPAMTRPSEILSSVVAASEREQLETFLDYLRDAVVRKARGVSEEDARRSPVPTGTNLGGLIKHLRWVELGRFAEQIGQIPAAELPRRRGPTQTRRPTCGWSRTRSSTTSSAPTRRSATAPRDRRPAQPRLRPHRGARS